MSSMNINLQPHLNIREEVCSYKIKEFPKVKVISKVVIYLKLELVQFFLNTVVIVTKKIEVLKVVMLDLKN